MDHETGDILSFYAYVEDGRPIQIAGWNFEIYGITFIDDEIRFIAAIQIPESGKIAETIPHLSGKYININEFVLDSSGNVKRFDVDIPLRFDFSIGNGIEVQAQELGISMHSGKLENLTLGLGDQQFSYLQN